MAGHRPKGLGSKGAQEVEKKCRKGVVGNRQGGDVTGQRAMAWGGQWREGREVGMDWGSNAEAAGSMKKRREWTINAMACGKRLAGNGKGGVRGKGKRKKQKCGGSCGWIDDGA